MENVIKRLNPVMLQSLCYQPEELYPTKVKAKSILIKKNRLDLILKYSVVKAIENKYFNSFYEEMFCEQVRVMTNGSYTEGDGSKKNYSQFKENLYSLISSIKTNGFDNRSIIPINQHGECIDGSHRLAVSAYFDVDVDVVEVNHHHQFDSSLFLKHGFDRKYIDDAIIGIVSDFEDLYIVNLHSLCHKHFEQVKYLIDSNAELIYHKPIYLNKGAYNWVVKTCYRTEAWINNQTVKEYTKNVYKNNQPINVFVIRSNRLEEVIALKKMIRELCNRGNFSVHITDTKAEAQELAKIYFNSNTLDLINRSQLLDLPNIYEFDIQLNAFKVWLMKNSIDTNDIVIDGSSVMNLYNLRETNDLDYVYYGNKKLTSKIYDDHSNLIHLHGVDEKTLIHDPDSFLYYEGVKFISLDTLRRFKSNRGEYPKDTFDLRLIDSVNEKNVLSSLNLFLIEIQRTAVNLYVNRKNIMNKIVNKIKRAILKFIPRDSLLIKYGKKTEAKLLYLFDSMKASKTLTEEEESSQVLSINYSGMNLYYSSGTSIVERFIRDGSYEKEEQDFIATYLNSLTGNKHMLDIGANIGMMTFNALSRVPELKVTSFEPGPHQQEFLRKNVLSNNLSDKVHVEGKALNDTNGTVEFAIHRSEDVSGDGLIDTKRAGGTKYIQVQSITLDSWWEINGKPNIDLIKMDVEGAELKIINGGVEVIRKQKPLILFEVHNHNLKVYPYDFNDISKKLEDLGYRIHNLDMSPLSRNQLDKLERFEPFGVDLVAIPIDG